MVVDAAKPCHLASEVVWLAIGILGHLLAVLFKPRICAEICHNLHLGNVCSIHGSPGTRQLVLSSIRNPVKGNEYQRRWTTKISVGDWTTRRWTRSRRCREICAWMSRYGDIF